MNTAFRVVIGGAGAFAFVGASLLVLNWLERKIGGHIQSRLGPYHVGWHGILQTFADVLKLIQKELITPRAAVAWLFLAAPFLAFIPMTYMFLAIPWSPTVYVLDANVAVFLLIAIPGLAAYGILAAGFASGNKYSLIASVRSIGQLFAYELPRTLAVLAVVMMAQTLSAHEMVAAQGRIWFVFVQPIAFLVFFIASLAEANRVPFDLTWAESELVSGFFTEYSGMRWAVFMMLEYGSLLGSCAIATLLFLGGWSGPFLPPLLWFIVKVFGLVLLSLWIRWTLPRVRIDQWLHFSWLVLFPLSIVNVVMTAVLMIWLGLGVSV